MNHCTRCGEELSDFSPCACLFTPHYPRASSSSATSSPSSMRALLESSGRGGRNLPILTSAQRGALRRLARGATHVHGGTAARLLLFGYARQLSAATSSGFRALFEITSAGLEAHHALTRADEDRSHP